MTAVSKVMYLNVMQHQIGHYFHFFDNENEAHKMLIIGFIYLAGITIIVTIGINSTASYIAAVVQCINPPIFAKELVPSIQATFALTLCVPI